MHINYKRVRRAAIILLVPVILVFFSINAVIFNQAVYEKQIPAEKIGLSNQVISFLKGSTRFLPEVFTFKEKAHLADVKQLIININLAGWSAVIFFFLLFLKEEDRLRILFHSLILSLAVLAFFMITVLSFQPSFTIFHQIFFKKGTWMFSPDSALINLYPFKFFHAMAVLILFQLLKYILAGLAVLAGIMLVKRVSKLLQFTNLSFFLIYMGKTQKSRFRKI